MNNPAIETSGGIPVTYADYESRITMRHLRVGCLLVMALMPVGVILDYFVYPEHVILFLGLRLACSALEFGVFMLLKTPFGKQEQRGLGLIVALLPAFFISWMIYATEGWVSPYYAGLNLILLAIAFVLRWSVGLSVLAAALITSLYLSACMLHSPFSEEIQGVFFNNCYFILLTDIIVVVGSRIHRVLRLNEYNLRYDLDRSNQMLEKSYEELAHNKLQLEKSNEMLEASKAELEESNKKLKELDALKSRFFANISHELRTPLTLLLAPLETLLQRFSSSFDEEMRSMLQTMHANGMRLLKLINDLLDLVRMESGRMEVKSEPLEVAELVNAIGSAARQVAEDKRLRLETYVDPALGTLMADRDKLEKIVLNLVFNALKFTPAGGKVEFRVEKICETFVLRIADTGMGIAQKHLPYIFDRFWQADDSSRRKYQGVGIGLALVKELVELQGGTVAVESKEGQGTTFTVIFPFVPAQPAPSPASAEASIEMPEPADSPFANATVTSEEWLTNLYRRAELFPALTPVHDALRPVDTSTYGLPKLLVADDEPGMLRFLKSQLGETFQVIEAADGQQAVEKATHFLPDIILLDMMMPEKDGLQACREIRELTPTQNIPIVLLTARADEETKMAALSAGASDFLTKPFSTAELEVRIRNLLERHDYQRELSRQNLVLESTNDRLKDTIEQLKETELQLVQSEKMRSLEKMSAGIIHEINNPLNFATTGLYVLRKKASQLPSGEQADFLDVLQDVEEGITRVKNIISDLRTFSHREVEGRDSVDLNEAVSFALRLLSHEWKQNITVHQTIPVGQAIWANRSLFIQVLINLFKNSMDALRSKTFAAGEQPGIWIEGQPSGDKNLLRIRDNGAGIAAEHVDKIFDPFYSTKDQGEGMGLGLSICYRIIDSFGGKISCKTEPGKFCEFSLEFPAPTTNLSPMAVPHTDSPKSSFQALEAHSAETPSGLLSIRTSQS